MKSLHFSFGRFEVDLNFHFAEAKPIEIRKYDVAPRDVLPDLRRFLYSRVKARRASPQA